MTQESQNLELLDEAKKEEEYGLSHEYSKDIIQTLNDDDKKRCLELIAELHVADIADFIDVLSHEHRRKFIEFIRDDFNPEILVELDISVKEEVLEFLGTKETAEAIISLDTDDAVDVIEDFAHEDQQEILQAISDKKQRKELEEGLAYPEDSAGRLLDKKIVTVPEFWTVGQTIDFLRSEKNIPDEFYQIFIVDPKMKPVGGVMLSRIMRSTRPTLMKDIMRDDLKTIRSDMDQEEVAYIFKQYSLASAPVVNEDGRMVGVITVDDVVHVMEEEAQEDFMRAGGLSGADLHSDFMETVKSRFPWLMINLFTAILASLVIGMFEGQISKLAALAVLMPIIASMGGNAGTQTVTVTVRAIATKELKAANAMRVIGKEIAVGSINGVIFAVIAGVMAYMWYDNLYLSVVFAIATILTLSLAGLSGALIPLGLVRAGVDPAIASSVILTTITDVVAFGAFLGIAAMVIL